MPDLTFDTLSHSYRSDAVLKNVSLTAKAGEITCLLGPSGCGKTTLLRLAAGLLRVQSGEIRLGDQVLASVSRVTPPEDRPIGLVFQDGALFPHMTVAENIGFGVRDASVREARIAALLALVGLDGFSDRYPDSLSGGQQQRVSLARALAPSPDVLLLDEPFANIDILLRRDLRAEMRRILKQTGTTVILVTHDPEEALDLADTIAVMEAGTIVQRGTPQDLYATPSSPTVAQLVCGFRTIKAERTDEGLQTSFGVWPTSAISNILPSTKELILALRTEQFMVSRPGSSARIVDLRPERGGIRVAIEADNGERIDLIQPPSSELAVGDMVAITPHSGAILAYAAVDPN